MALIGTIRKNTWILVGMLGFGLVALVIMFAINDSNINLFGNPNAMGTIAGEPIDAQAFNQKTQDLYGGQGDFLANRENMWNYYVQQVLVEKEAKKLGLAVGDDELNELQFGADNMISPIIRQRFSDPNTRQLDRERLEGIRGAIQNGTLEEQDIKYWAQQEELVELTSLQSKMDALVTKAIYTPTWLAEQSYQDQNQRVDFDYVLVPFDQIDDAGMEVSDADISAYINENKAAFTNDQPTRNVEYISFNVRPTGRDSMMLRSEVRSMMADLRSGDGNDSLFAVQNGGAADAKYFTSDELRSHPLADTLFDVAAGTVLGPYSDGNSYKAVKVMDYRTVADSVKSRHILRPLDKTSQQAFNNSYFAEKNRLDSLIVELEAGRAVFDSLAADLGTDGTRTRGGDLGYTGQGGMVKPFNDLIFFQADKGDYYTVLTEFGLHLVQVTGTKGAKQGVRLADISKLIVPSETTEDSIRNLAQDFIDDAYAEKQSLREAAVASNMSLQNSPAFARNDYNIQGLGSGQTSRDLVRWAFGEDGDVEVGNIAPEVYAYASPVGYYTDKFIVAGLASVRPKGLAKAADVKNDVMPLVKNKMKADKLKSVKPDSLAAVANMYDEAEVQSVQGAAFAAPNAFVPGLGAEPEVLAAVFSTKQGEISEPIVGTSGIYFVKPTYVPAPPAAPAAADSKKSMTQQKRSGMAGLLYNAMRNAADIDDARHKFF